VASGGSDVELGVQITKKGEGDREAAEGLKKVGRAADDAADELARLDRKLVETKALMAAAGKEFVRTGDISPLRGLLKDERQLNQVKKSLEGVKKEGFDVAEVFTDLSGVIGKGLEAGLSSPQFIAIGAAIAVPLSAGLSAALSGAVLAGTAGAGLAAGILLAARSADVQDAWSTLGQSALKNLGDAAVSFEQPLVRAAHTFGDEIDKDLPRIRKDFEILSPLVDDLAKGAAGFVHGLQPGLADAFRGAVPVVRELSSEMPKLGDDVSKFFSELGGSGRAGAEALGITIDGLGSSLRILGTGLAEASTLFELTGTGALGLLHNLGLLADTADLLTASGLTALTELLNHGKDNSDDFSKSLDTLTTSMSQASADAAFNEGMNSATQALRAGQQAAADLEHQVSSLAQTMLASKNTDLAYKQGHLDLVEALKASHGALNDNTEAGLRSQEALVGQAQKAIAVRDAVLQQTGSVQAADTVFQAHIAQIYADAAANGVAKDKVDDLIGSLNTIPHPDPIDIELKRQGYSDDDLRELKRAVYIPSTSATVTVTYRTITVDEHYTRQGEYNQQVPAFGYGGLIPAAASGLIATGPVLLGERTTPEAAIPAPNSGISRRRAAGLLSTAAAWWGMEVGPKRGAGDPAAAAGPVQLHPATVDRLAYKIGEEIATRAQGTRGVATIADLLARGG
jgi:hypothetical protein